MSKASPAEQAPAQAVALFQSGLPTAPPSYLQDEAPRGNESVTPADMAMPRLKLLQPLNPEVDQDRGVLPGMFYNTITGRAAKELYAINLHFRKEFTVFKKRELGGGLVGTADSETEAREFAASLPGNADDYEISESHRHVLVLLDDKGQPSDTVALFLANTSGLYSSRAWNTELQSLCANKFSRFAPIWKLRTGKQTNTKGTFYTLETEFVGWAPEELHSVARKMYDAVAGSVSKQ